MRYIDEKNAGANVIMEKHRLLIADDDEKILEQILEYFGRVGFDVSAAMDGITALETLAKEEPFDVFVTDLMMPKMDGLALIRRVREEWPTLPILMLTAKDDVVDKLIGLEKGADDYITKPFSLREL